MEDGEDRTDGCKWQFLSPAMPCPPRTLEGMPPVEDGMPEDTAQRSTAGAPGGGCPAASPGSSSSPRGALGQVAFGECVFLAAEAGPFAGGADGHK